MQEFGGFSGALAILASAAGCGLLMGIERERRKLKAMGVSIDSLSCSQKEYLNG